MKSVLFRASIVALIFIVGSIIGYNYKYKNKGLKIYSAADLNPALVGADSSKLDKPHFIGDFTLINQLGKTITPENFKDKIYVANFIFTTCPGICPIMTNNMETVYKKFKSDSQILFISHTVMPETDSVPVLLKYANKKGADANKWFFVTGKKTQLYDLARNQYFAAISEGNGSAEDFVHTENFVLVDTKKRIRGIYDGTSFDEIDKLILDIQTLKEEK